MEISLSEQDVAILRHVAGNHRDQGPLRGTSGVSGRKLLCWNYVTGGLSHDSLMTPQSKKCQLCRNVAVAVESLSVQFGKMDEQSVVRPHCSPPSSVQAVFDFIKHSAADRFTWIVFLKLTEIKEPPPPPTH